MDARTLGNELSWDGERAVRRILIEEKLAKSEEVALMTCVQVCSKLLETYEVVSCEKEVITVVNRDDMQTYNSIVKVLGR